MGTVSLLSAGLAACLVFSAVDISDGSPPAPRAREFDLTDSEGKLYKLSDYRDKILVLEWINTSCPYVIQHYHEGTMKKLASHYAPLDVVWLAINSSATVTAAEMREWRREHDLPYPILLDPSGDVGRAYQAKSTPHLFIIRNYEILYQGAIDNARAKNRTKPVNYIAQALEEILAGESVSVAATKPYGCTVRYAKKITKWISSKP